MIKRPNCALLLALFLCGLPQLSTLGWAQGPSGDNPVSPEVTSALKRMGAFLRGLNAFQVKAQITTEDVLVDGQKIQYSTVTDLVARRPDRVRINVVSDLQERVFLYDGKTFTLWAPRSNYYASVPAPGTIVELVDRLDEKFGIEMPLVDLFRWGQSDNDVAGISSAIDIGPSTVEGTTVEQYALRQRGLDWQIWIQSGDYPLPRKVVATTISDDARPEYTVVYTWNLAPSFNDASFVFIPPKDAQKIAIAELKDAADSVRTQQPR